MDKDGVSDGVCIDLDHLGPYSIFSKEVKCLMCHKLSVEHLHYIFGMDCSIIIEEEGSDRILHLLLYPCDRSLVE